MPSRYLVIGWNTCKLLVLLWSVLTCVSPVPCCRHMTAPAGMCRSPEMAHSIRQCHGVLLLTCAESHDVLLPSEQILLTCVVRMCCSLVLNAAAGYTCQTGHAHVPYKPCSLHAWPIQTADMVLSQLLLFSYVLLLLQVPQGLV